MRSIPLLALGLAAGLLAWSACNEHGPGPKRAKTRLHHHFGTLRHGLSLEHTFEIPLPEADEEVIPVTFWHDCKCANGQLLIQDAQGRNRLVSSLPRADARVREGERLLLRVTLDTSSMEPATVPEKTADASVRFESLRNVNPRAYFVPLTFNWGIHAPVRLEPVAAVGIGELPLSKSFTQPLQLHCNIPGHDLRLGEVHVGSDVVQAKLTNKTDSRPYKLEITVRAPPQHRGGFFKTIVRVETNIANDGSKEHFYQIPIEVSGKLIPDIEVVGGSFLDFGMLDEKASKQLFRNIVDHDASRPAGFVLDGIRNDNGADVGKHFEVRFEQLDKRTTRIWVKYLGGLGKGIVRGELSLAKNDGGPVLVPMRFRAYTKLQ